MDGPAPSGSVSIAFLLLLGVALMANPLYLPIAVDEPSPVYTHVVQPVGVDTPTYGDADVVESVALQPDAWEAFDRALSARDGGFVVDDPNERVESLSYPTEPSLGDGLVIVAHGDEEYEFWTRTVERDPASVVVQRVLLQPIVFLVGFLSVVAAVAVAVRGCR